MKYVLYRRVSTDKQGIDGYGIGAQQEAADRFIASRPDSEIVATYSEVESGRVNNRPELAKAITLCKSQGFTLLLSKLDRLSRSSSFLISLQESKLDFVALDCIGLDKFSIGVLALCAAREVETLSARVRAGLAVARQRGIRLGAPPAKLAVARLGARQAVQAKKLAFAESLKKPIAEIRSTGCQTYQSIADCLTRRGMTSPRGKQITASTVRRVLAA